MSQITEQMIDEMTAAIVREIDPEQIYLFGSRTRGGCQAGFGC
jgi:predicted nucleotidyltransferase